MTRTFAASVAACAAVVFWPAVAFACPVCFQLEDGPAASGIRAAVIVLVAVTTAVLTAFGIFAVRFAKRASSSP